LKSDINKKLKYWQGRKVKHIDSISHLNLKLYSLIMIREIVKKALTVEIKIQVKNFYDIHNFLQKCNYTSDEVLFNRSDYWQTPDQFEINQSGDCEDFSLWAWRKLIDIGKNARFTVGSDDYVGHAWVTIFQNKDILIYEPTNKSDIKHIPIISVLEINSYKPSFSIDKKLNFYQHI
jgi:hypothetical protein